MFVGFTSHKTDIIPLVRLCWYMSFGNVGAIKKAIPKCSWGSYNRVLLLHHAIQASMIESMINEEKKSELFPHNQLSHLHTLYYKEQSSGRVTLHHAREDEEDYRSINLDGGATLRNVTSVIMSDSNRQVAREQSQKLKE